MMNPKEEIESHEMDGDQTKLSKKLILRPQSEAMTAFQADNNGITPLQTFTYFPLLPKELRLIIWSFVLPRPRIITITEPVKTRSAFLRSGLLPYHYVSSFISSTRATKDSQVAHSSIPIVFHINRESRDVGFKNYQLIDGAELNTQRPFYFNFNTDILQMWATSGLGTRNLGTAIRHQEHQPERMLQVKKLLQSMVITGYFARFDVQFPEFITEYSKLQEIIVTLPEITNSPEIKRYCGVILGRCRTGLERWQPFVDGRIKFKFVTKRDFDTWARDTTSDIKQWTYVDSGTHADN